MRLELLQAVRQDIRGNPFSRFLELLKGVKSADHQVANDQQRPAIPESLEGDTDRAAGSWLRLRICGHADTLAKITCKKQVTQTKPALTCQRL